MFSMICFAPLCLASMIPSGQRVCARCPIPAPFLAKRERAWGRLCGLFLSILTSTHVLHECLLSMLCTYCPTPMHDSDCVCFAYAYRSTSPLPYCPSQYLVASKRTADGNRRTTPLLASDSVMSARRGSVGRPWRTRRVSQKSRLCGSRRNESEERKRCESPRRAIAKGSPKRTC